MKHLNTLFNFSFVSLNSSCSFSWALIGIYFHVVIVFVVCPSLQKCSWFFGLVHTSNTSSALTSSTDEQSAVNNDDYSSGSHAMLRSVTIIYTWLWKHGPAGTFIRVIFHTLAVVVSQHPRMPQCLCLCFRGAELDVRLRAAGARG